jgi:NADH-quinone oxidoreductase subunit C
VTTPAARSVERTDWASAVAQLPAEGFTMVDLVTAIDRIDHLEVIAVVARPETGDRVLLRTAVPADRPEITSVCAVLPGAEWHERETAEMFGIRFVGHPDPRPLLLRPTGQESEAMPPLLKAAALESRVVVAWPGAPTGEEGRRARRPQLPPGVRAEWMQEVGER